MAQGVKRLEAQKVFVVVAPKLVGAVRRLVRRDVEVCCCGTRYRLEGEVWRTGIVLCDVSDQVAADLRALVADRVDGPGEVLFLGKVLES